MRMGRSWMNMGRIRMRMRSGRMGGRMRMGRWMKLRRGMRIGKSWLRTRSLQLPMPDRCWWSILEFDLEPFHHVSQMLFQLENNQNLINNKLVDLNCSVID